MCGTLCCVLLTSSLLLSYGLSSGLPVELLPSTLMASSCDIGRLMEAALSWLEQKHREVVLTSVGSAHPAATNDTLARLSRCSAAPFIVMRRPEVAPPLPEVPFETLSPRRRRGGLRWRPPVHAHLFVAANIDEISNYFWRPKIALPVNMTDMYKVYGRIYRHSLKPTTEINPQSNILVVLIDFNITCSIDVASLSNFFRILSSRGLLNVVLYLQRDDCPDSLLLYSPFIIHDGYYGKLSIFQTTSSSYLSDEFHRRLHNMNSYIIRTSDHSNPPETYVIDVGNTIIMGRNVFILETFQEKMNFSVESVAGNWLMGENNYVCARTSLDLFFHKADFGTNVCSWHNAIATGFQGTLAFCDIDSLSIIVAYSPALEAWRVPFLAFSIKVWGCTILTYFASVICWTIIRLYKEEYKENSIFQSFVNLGRVYISASWSGIWMISSVPERVLLSFCLLCSSVVLVSAFHGRVYELLTHPPRYPEIDTLQDLDNSDLSLFYQEKTIPNVFSYNGTDGHLQEKMVFIDRDKMSYNELLEEKILSYKGAVITSKVFLDFYRACMPELFLRVHKLREHLFSDIGTFLVPEESPYLNRFNVLLRRMTESGLIDLWDKNGLESFAKFVQKYNPVTIKNIKLISKNTLGLSELFFSVIVFIVGNITATAVFFIEVTLCRIMRCCNRNYLKPFQRTSKILFSKNDSYRSVKIF